MASPAVYDSIEAFIKVEWAGRTPVAFENEPWPLEDQPAAFLYVEIFGGLYAQESIGQPGDNLWREAGTMLGHILVPKETGTREARTYARAFVDLFREVEVDGIRFRDMSISAGEPGDQDGNYYRMTASVEWERDD